MARHSVSQTALVRGRVDARRKARVDRILHKLGLTTADALNLFYAQVEQRRGLPFDVVLHREPSEETLSSLNEDVHRRPMFDSVDALMRSLRNGSKA